MALIQLGNKKKSIGDNVKDDQADGQNVTKESQTLDMSVPQIVALLRQL